MERSALTGAFPQSRFEPSGAGARVERGLGEKSFAWRWPVVGGVAVALLGPTLAIAASQRWGALVAAGVVLLEALALTLIAGLAVRQRETWLRARARNERLESARRAAMDVAGATLHASDGLTGEHSDEVAQLCEVLCEEFEIEGDERMRVLMAAHLHDIGKVAVSKDILNKPGPLDQDEWAVIKEHTLVGERILEAVPELGQAATLVRHSHEHWDGTGYPDGLAGDEIPLGSRVVLTADAFHAIRSDRPYRQGRSPREALAELKAHAGTQFDPLIVAALERQASRLRAGMLGRVPLSRRTVALLIGGILLLAGTALATGLWPISKPDAGAPPAHLPDRGATPAAKAKHAAPRSGAHRANRNAARLQGGSTSQAAPSLRRRGPAAGHNLPPSGGGSAGTTGTQTQAPNRASGRGPDHITPVRAHGNPVQANGVAVGRPPTVTPQGNGAGVPGAPSNGKP